MPSATQVRESDSQSVTSVGVEFNLLLRKQRNTCVCVHISCTRNGVGHICEHLELPLLRFLCAPRLLITVFREDKEIRASSLQAPK